MNIIANGRISRKTYLFRASISLFLTVMVGLYLTHPIFNILIISGLLYFIIQTIKRLHDINLSGWFTLLMIVPIVNILFGAYVVLKKGRN